MGSRPSAQCAIQQPNKALPRRAPWHRRTKELQLKAKLPRYKEGPKLRGESGYKKHKAPESMADSVWLKRSAAGRRPETRQALRRQKTTVHHQALFTAAQVTSDTKPREHRSPQVNYKIKKIKTSVNVQYFQIVVLKINIKIQDV